MQLRIGLLLTVLALGQNPAQGADVELIAPDGRTVRLKDDGTWKYVDAKDTKAGPGDVAKPAQALLQLEDRTPFGPNCRIELKMANNLPYEIVQIVPYFSAFRASGVVHQSLGAGFQNVRPADSRIRVLEFTGIACNDITRIQVVGGDRCEMGDLSKFTPDKGVCLGRVQVVPSKLLIFEK